jgi:allophanate hydrolase
MNQADLSPSALVADYRAGRRRPRDVLELVYGRIASSGERPVWIAVESFERALAALERAERHARNGALFGVPFAVKDNIDVAGLPTTAGCPEFSYLPERHAHAVELLIREGALVIGKTNLDQFATGLVGTRSPYGACASVYDARYISGGSSSGSAVAVASGQAAFALGTDTAGSGRVPAAFNGLVGLKPTRGLVSTSGVVPACRSLDCVSIFAPSVADAELVLEVARGFDASDPFSRTPSFPRTSGRARLTLGVPLSSSLEFFGDTESARMFEAAVERFVALGAETVDVDLGPFREAARLLYTGPWVAERMAAIGDFLERRPEAVHPVVRGIVEQAARYSARDAFEGSYRLAALRRAIEPTLATFDALVVPTAPSHYTIEQVLAEPIRLNSNLGTYTNFVNLLDMSGLALPAGMRRDGLPFGVTLLGPAFADERLTEIARLFAGEAGAVRAPTRGRVWLAVAGAHLSGQPLNHELTSRGARRIRMARTAPCYRLYALATTPPKPGLVRAASAAHAIEVEVWELDEAGFGAFVAGVPGPMTIGSVELEDGSLVKGFACEPYALEGAREISAHGGWRAYLSSKTPSP